MLGVPWDEVHEEAERLEHAMSPVLEERMLAAIGDAKTCPHGHPIAAGSRLAGVPLADVEVGAEVQILRFENEAEDLLRYLKVSGVEPGLKGTLVERDATKVVIRSEDGAICAVTPSVAETVSVIADPSPPPRTALPEQLVLARALRALARHAARARQRAVRLGQPRDALLDLLGRDPRVGEAQRVLAALEQEVGALDERDARARRLRRRARCTSVPSRQRDPHEVAALRRDELGLGQLAAQRLGERPRALGERRA